MKLQSDDKSANLESNLPQATNDPFKDVPVLSTTKAQLYLFDTESDMFVSQEKEVTVETALNAPYESRSRAVRAQLTISLDRYPAEFDTFHQSTH